jgi:membrane protease YdiL (CAAX protease family)
MTSLFEEVFFRGFIQTRFEKAFGAIPAIMLSGLTFSLYHLGYPNYRNLKLLFVLFLVGMFFAIAFRITNNVITSFLVNVPHAIISFIENGSYFSTKVSVISVFTTILGLFLIFYFYATQTTNAK